MQSHRLAFHIQQNTENRTKVRNCTIFKKTGAFKKKVNGTKKETICN